MVEVGRASVATFIIDGGDKNQVIVDRRIQMVADLFEFHSII
jgi:hypothetical protein